jgi:hypothetical protein
VPSVSKAVEYEQVTRAIFQALVDQDEARNIDVQHNVTLPGKFLNHQVDVYWKFESGGIEYSTVVECKDWNRPLEQEKLLAFKSKLEDLNNPTGVIVTRSGYQSGALKYAHAHGIYLYELFEEPPLVMKEGTFGRMKVTPYLINDQSQEIELVAEWIFYEPHYVDNRFYVDRDWFEVQLGKFEDEIVPEISQFKLPVQRLSMTKLYDETHNEIGNVLAIFAKRSEQMLENNETSGRLIHRFSESTFLKTEHRLLPYLKVTGLSTNVTIKKHEPIIRPMRTQGFVHFVLRNLRDGSEQVIRLRQN